MSYLSAPIPEIKPVRTVRLSDKEAFPDGTTYIVFGVGRVDKNTTGNYYWDNSAKGLDTEAIPKNECALWVDEKTRQGAQNPGGFINWLYTGSDKDPAHVLGLDDPQLETITARRKTNAKFVVRQPQLSYFVPIMKVNQVRKGKEINYDLDNGEMLHLVLSASQFDKVLSEAKRFADEDESDMAGRIIQVEVDRNNKNKSDIYKFMANSRIYTVEANPELHEKFANERLEILKRIESQIAEVHNGIWGDPDASAQAVWNYMLAQTGMQLNDFIQKYYSGPESRIIDNDGETGLSLSEFSIDDE